MKGATHTNNRRTKEIFRYKLRAAIMTGSVFAPFAAKIVRRSTDGILPEKTPGEPDRVAGKSIVVVCEGPIDERILGGLTKKILSQYELSAEVSFLTSLGIDNLPRVANQVAQRSSGPVIVVMDSEYRSKTVERKLRKRLDFEPAAIVLPEPSIDSWLWKKEHETMMDFMRACRDDSEYFARSINEADLEQLSASKPSFKKYLDAILSHAV